MNLVEEGEGAEEEGPEVDPLVEAPFHLFVTIAPWQHPKPHRRCESKPVEEGPTASNRGAESRAAAPLRTSKEFIQRRSKRRPSQCCQWNSRNCLQGGSHAHLA